MSNLRSIGWVAALLFGVCMALRLARFNTQLVLTDPPPYAYKFFTGVPAPAAAGLVMIPLVASFEFGADFLRSPWLNVAITSAIGALMVSRVPTYSLKKVHVPHEYVAPLLVVVALLAAFLTTEPWLTLLFVGSVYFISIPFSVRSYLAHKREAIAERAMIRPELATLRPVEKSLEE